MMQPLSQNRRLKKNKRYLMHLFTAMALICLWSFLLSGFFLSQLSVFNRHRLPTEQRQKQRLPQASTQSNLRYPFPSHRVGPFCRSSSPFLHLLSFYIIYFLSLPVILCRFLSYLLISCQGHKQIKQRRACLETKLSFYQVTTFYLYRLSWMTVWVWRSVISPKRQETKQNKKKIHLFISLFIRDT